LLEDLRRETERFGVAEQQVRRDHLISHMLAAISTCCDDGLIFFGGTALSRTHLVHARMSEDIDLIATAPRVEVIPRLVTTLERALMRTHGRPTWAPGFSDHDTDAAVLSAAGAQVKVQLLRGEHYPAWPVERRVVEQRYADAAPATLTVPTLPSFVGWKTVAWSDRGAPRDLYDLWALNDIGALTTEAATLFARYGPTGNAPRPFMFTTAPSERDWRASLSGQTRLDVTAERALREVRQGWTHALGEQLD
jgi:hypothetical protein